MSLTGNFDLNEISILTDKMRIPGGDDLKKATKGKKKMKTIYSFDFCLLLLVVTQNRRRKYFGKIRKIKISLLDVSPSILN
jgi:hypothetical protein